VYLADKLDMMQKLAFVSLAVDLRRQILVVESGDVLMYRAPMSLSKVKTTPPSLFKIAKKPEPRKLLGKPFRR